MSGKGKSQKLKNLPRALDPTEPQARDRADLHPHETIAQEQDTKRRIGQHQGRGEAPLMKK